MFYVLSFYSIGPQSSSLHKMVHIVHQGACDIVPLLCVLESPVWQRLCSHITPLYLADPDTADIAVPMSCINLCMVVVWKSVVVKSCVLER